MAEAMRYPLMARRRRPRRHGLRVPTLPHLRRLVALAVLLAVAAAAAVMVRGSRPDPQSSYRMGLIALHDGRFDEARRHLAAALPIEPVRARLALARVAVEEEDEATAGVLLQRAATTGAAVDALRPLRAAVLLLGGDADGALAATAGPVRDIGLAVRVRARALAATGDGAAGERLLASWADRHGDAAAWSDLGRLRLLRGDMAGAGDAARRALALAGGWPAALCLQAEVVRSRYGLVAALPWFDAALARDPAYLPALIGRAATRGEAGRYAGALADARAALAVRPAALQPLYLLATIAARAGRPALAGRLLQRMGDAIDTVPGAQLLAGWAAGADGHPELAIARWQALVDAQPFNLTARRLLGAALLRAGDAAGATEMLAPVIARPDADAYALEVAARAARIGGDPKRAAALHDRAVAGARGAATPLAGGEAVAALAQTAASAPGDSGAAVALVGGLLASGDGNGALARAQALAGGQSGIAAAQLVLGDTLAGLNRPAEAAAVYARAADLLFDEPTLLRLVDAAVRAGRTADAASALALYLSQHPQSPGARLLAAHWQAAAGERAAVASTDALRAALGHRHAMLLADAALARVAAHDGARAIVFARAAYRLAPMNPALIDAYARALDAGGDRDGARQLRAKLAMLAPG